MLAGNALKNQLRKQDLNPAELKRETSLHWPCGVRPRDAALSVLFQQMIDHLLLGPIHPASEAQRESPKRLSA